MDFSYPHNDTSMPERPSRTGNINKLVAHPLVKGIRADAFVRRIPVSSDETLQFICVQARACGAENILEIGAAVGASGIALLQTCPQARLTTIEKKCRFRRRGAGKFRARRAFGQGKAFKRRRRRHSASARRAVRFYLSRRAQSTVRKVAAPFKAPAALGRHARRRRRSVVRLGQRRSSRAPKAAHAR